MGYSLCMIADFQNIVISRTFCVSLGRFFPQNNSKWFVEGILKGLLKF